MAFSRLGRGAMAASLSIAMGLGLAACSRTFTVGYVYMTASQPNPGLVNGYKVDFQSGVLVPLEDSPVPSGGKNPIAIVAAPNSKNLYVVNRDDSTVVWMAIGTDGKLYPQKTYNTTGSFPLSAAIDPAGKFLYVVYTYQIGFTTALPGPGGVTVFPIAADNSLGTALNVNVGRNPVALTANSQFVYVVAQDTATNLNLFGFAANSTTGLLTPLPGTTINAGNVPSVGYAIGTTPGGIIEDPSLKHLYVTDQANNRLVGYTVGTNGVPTQLAVAPTASGPSGMTIEASGKYLYVANTADGSIGGYTFGPNGEPVQSTVAQTVQSGTGTNCVTTLGVPTSASPTHAIYLYASNNISNSVTGEQLNPADGSLKQIQGTPFGGSGLPTCLVSVPSLR